MQKHWVWPDLPKNANVKSFPLFEEFELFLHGASTWLTGLLLAGNAMDPVLGSWLNTWEAEETSFLFLRSFSTAGTGSLERPSYTQKNGWAPYRPDRKTTNRPGHLHYSCWSTSSMTAVWSYIFSQWKLLLLRSCLYEDLHSTQRMSLSAFLDSRIRIVIPID